MPLVSGAEAYPAMLETMESATESIGLERSVSRGVNIKREYWNPEAESLAFRDLHFRLSDPVGSFFADDWQFTTTEALRGKKWFPTLPLCGGMLAPGVEAGPDESFERLRWVICLLRRCEVENLPGLIAGRLEAF